MKDPRKEHVREGGKVRGTSGRGRSRPLVDSGLVSCRVKASSRGLIRVRSSQGQSGQVTSRSVKSFESKSRSVKEGQSSSDVKTSRVKSCESKVKPSHVKAMSCRVKSAGESKSKLTKVGLVQSVVIIIYRAPCQKSPKCLQRHKDTFMSSHSLTHSLTHHDHDQK